MENDSLGDRMKSQYEDRTRYTLPRRTYTVIRIDGKAFHTYTRGADKPFDSQLMSAMDYTTEYLCCEIQGAQFGYTQSDEISILVTDFDKITTSAWFDGNIQKVASVAASISTGAFNKYMTGLPSWKDHVAFFDARAFTIPDPIEVANYFIWRQKDAVRNSISMAARSVYSHKELHGRSTSNQQEMLFKKGINWDKYPTRCKRGGLIAYQDMKWQSVELPVFTRDTSFLENLIPVHPDFQRIKTAS